MTIASRTLMTGFTAFGRFRENPSASLAASCGRPFHLIEVAYSAADSFIESINESSFDRMIMLGVAGTSDALRMERIARNRIGDTPDVRGVVPAQRMVFPTAPPEIAATLWPPSRPLPSGVTFSDDAGDYLCNYLAFRALQRFAASKRVGFLHVPPLEAMDRERQADCLNAVLRCVEDGDSR